MSFNVEFAIDLAEKNVFKERISDGSKDSPKISRGDRIFGKTRKKKLLFTIILFFDILKMNVLFQQFFFKNHYFIILLFYFTSTFCWSVLRGRFRKHWR